MGAAFKLVQRIFAVAGVGHLKAGMSERLDGHTAQQQVVIDHQQMGRFL